MCHSKPIPHRNQRDLGVRWLVFLAAALVVTAGGAGSAVANVAVDDTYSTLTGEPLVVEAPGVLENDHNGAGDDLPPTATAVLVSDVGHGTLSLASDGSFQYIPDADFFGADSFSYHIVDGAAVSNTATVTISVDACAGGVLPTQTVCWREGAFLAELASLGLIAISEGFEDDVAWGGARSPDTLPSVTSQGVTWASNFAANGITTGSGPARTGLWGGYSLPHGDTSGPPTSFIYDGFTGSGPGGDTLFAAGGWLSGTFGGQVNFELRTSGGGSTVLGFPDGGLTPIHRYFGVIDTAGFETFEVFETEGTVEQQLIVFGDDFTVATATGADSVPPQVELVNSVADTGDGVLSEGEATSAAITELLVHFSEPVFDVAGNTDPDDVTNPANYLLIEANGNGFQTVDCAGGVGGNDGQVAVDGVAYTSGTHPVSNLALNGGVALPAGSYRLLVCGTTSIRDWAGNPLDGDGDGTGGDDFIRSFAVVLPPNNPPVADPQSVSTPEDTAKAITLTGSDLDGDPMTFSIVTPPGHGGLSGTPPNVTYTPAANYNGPDSFTFRIWDGTVFGNTATVSITVTPVNDPPTANPQSVSTPEDTAKAITLTGSDVDGDPMTFSIVTGPSHGSLSGTPPSVTYTPASNYNGPDSFTFRIWDGTEFGNTATVSITVTPVNDAPTADPQSVSTPQDTAVGITLTGSDPDGDTLTFSIVTPPGHGGLSGAPPDVTYTPTGGYFGPDSFTFRVWDGSVFSTTATVSITVTEVGVSVVTIGDASITEGDGGSAPVNLTITLTPAGGDAVSVDWATGGGTAASGTDYVAASGTADIPAGGTSATVPVQVNGDLMDEPDETFDVALSNPVGAELGVPSTGTVTIFDDDPMPDLSAIDVAVPESSGQALVELTLSAASGYPVSVDYATADGTATAPDDYGAVAGTATINSGDVSTTVSVAIVNDTAIEADETFILELSNPSNGVLLTLSVTVTIEDDDNNLLFEDGFESGDWSEWSAAVP